MYKVDDCINILNLRCKIIEYLKIDLNFDVDIDGFDKMVFYCIYIIWKVYLR